MIFLSIVLHPSVSGAFTSPPWQDLSRVASQEKDSWLSLWSDGSIFWSHSSILTKYTQGEFQSVKGQGQWLLLSFFSSSFLLFWSLLLITRRRRIHFKQLLRKKGLLWFLSQLFYDPRRSFADSLGTSLCQISLDLLHHVTLSTPIRSFIATCGCLVGVSHDTGLRENSRVSFIGSV